MRTLILMIAMNFLVACEPPNVGMASRNTGGDELIGAAPSGSVTINNQHFIKGVYGSECLVDSELLSRAFSVTIEDTNVAISEIFYENDACTGSGYETVKLSYSPHKNRHYLTNTHYTKNEESDYNAITCVFTPEFEIGQEVELNRASCNLEKISSIPFIYIHDDGTVSLGTETLTL